MIYNENDPSADKHDEGQIQVNTFDQVRAYKAMSKSPVDKRKVMGPDGRWPDKILGRQPQQKLIGETHDGFQNL